MTETTETLQPPLAFVDTETDGVHPGRRPWEIAVIRREPDGTETEWSAFIEIDLSTANPFGLRVGKFYDRHPLGRRISGDDDLPQPYRENILGLHHAAMTVAQLTHGARIIGAVPNFDMETLDPLLRAHGLVPTWHYTPWCIKTLMVGYFRGRGERGNFNGSSERLTEMLGVAPTPPEEWHTALGDARWAQRVYDAIMDGAA